MEITKKYSLINNIAGWAVFAVALLTYWLTLEPTVSYWDCGEFITQADKLEIGHPPGNPIFMLTARFFSNFAFGQADKVALMVNAMSGLLSALTILLLFWTVTHLATRLLVRGGNTATMTRAQYLAVMGSGVVGALAYAWSDTFWFSAVEGEVYAFSSFCTALVFWLILKWENRADEPHSDRYLILIAYVIGISIAVHLLNLLCIPAIVLVFAFRKWKEMNLKKSLWALLAGFAIIVLVLFGLVPGFIKVAGWFELFAVNSLGMKFNTGVGLYTLLTVGCFVWALRELHVQRSAQRIRLAVCASVVLSGMLFIGSSWWLGLLLTAVMVYYLWFGFRGGLPVRWLNVAMWSIAVIFIGYSSYALILIRAHANPPLNQSAPDNVFALSGYLNREQYGDVPLLYGQTFRSPNHYKYSEVYDMPIGGGEVATGVPDYKPDFKKGKAEYAKGVKGAQAVSGLDLLSKSEQRANEQRAKRGGDYYVLADYMSTLEPAPSTNMLLPRIHSRASGHRQQYELWVPSLASPEHETTEVTALNEQTGREEPMVEISSESLKYNEFTGEYNFTATSSTVKPSFLENLEFFFSYQLNHMYWRYFLWNFAGRQNDYNNQQNERDLGNWLTGFAAIDNARLGDQSLLPDNLGEGNAAHNVFYCLPLLLGLIGLFWQAFRGKKGIEQFWVVFFLFFMTGIAIVLYLNQPPAQPRERDYAYAGSFYAYAIWIGLGVAALWRGILRGLERMDKASAAGAKNASSAGAKNASASSEERKGRNELTAAIAACVLGLAVPLQMVSQTWDDHDRSGRYAALDYARNYLESAEPNAIIFCNGDNDTFPLWYAHEVEGVRPDVKIINMSYLQSDWYANQQRLMTNKAPGVKFTATEADIAYSRREMAMTQPGYTNADTIVELTEALKAIYSPRAPYNEYGYAQIPYSNTYIKVDKKAARERGLYNAEHPEEMADYIAVDLESISGGQLTQSQLMVLDIIATNAANGWERPIYWAGTVGTEYYSMFQPYLRAVGMNYQLVPYRGELRTDTERTYEIVTKKYRWGGGEKPGRKPYFDETANRMASFTRMTIINLATDLIAEAEEQLLNAEESKAADNTAGYNQWKKRADRSLNRAREVLDLMVKNLPCEVSPYSFYDYVNTGEDYCRIAGYKAADKAYKGDKADKAAKAAYTAGLKLLTEGLTRYSRNVKYTMRLIEKYGCSSMLSQGETYAVPYTPNVSVSIENSQILAVYYELVDLYEQYAGKEASEELMKKLGLEKLMPTLKQNYDLTHGGASGAGTEPGSEGGAGELTFTPEQVEEEILAYVEDIRRIQSLSPADYSALSQEDLEADSLFIYLINLYEMTGGERAGLESKLEGLGIDLKRSEAIFGEFVAKHPDLFE